MWTRKGTYFECQFTGVIIGALQFFLHMEEICLLVTWILTEPVEILLLSAALERDLFTVELNQTSDVTRVTSQGSKMSNL